jgi:hypothetical protein
MELEDGIEVKFESGSYKTGDYWLIPARTITKDIEWSRTNGVPDALPADGIEHYYAPLSLIQFDDNKTIKPIADCRQFFSSSTLLTTHSGLRSTVVEGGSFKIVGPVYHKVPGIIPPAIILGETDVTNNMVKYREDLALFSVLNSAFGFIPKEDTQNPPGLVAQLGLNAHLNMNEQSSQILFKPVLIDTQKFHIIIANYDKNHSKQITLRWWAIPAVDELDIQV